MKKEQWVWMGHPAHFICARDCRFHLATYVGNYIVSTVGELWQDKVVRESHARVHDPEWLRKNSHLLGDYFDAAYFKRFGYGELHSGGWTYETMVFRAAKVKGKEPKDMCCPWRIIVNKSTQEEVYKSSDVAYRGHMKLCKKWAKQK